MKTLNHEKTLYKDATNFRLWLQGEYERRCRKNSKYSLRAFANLLGVDPSSVSQLLSGKRSASKKLVQRLCNKLDVHPLVAEKLVENTKARGAQGYIFRGDFKAENLEDIDYRQLALDAFSIIGDWYHYAILELTTVHGFKSDPLWIARTLNISVTEVKVAIERLKRLEMIAEINGKLIQTESSLTNGVSGIATSGAHKQLQKQVLQKALDAVDDIPQEIKDITSMTMAIDVSKIPQARKVIQKFRRDLCEFLENGKKENVYHLGIQLYPVSKRIIEKD